MQLPSPVNISIRISICLFGFNVAIMHGVPGSIFDLAHSIADLALDLMRHAFSLHFLVPSPLAGLSLHASGQVFHLSLHTVFVPEFPSANWFRAKPLSVCR